MSVFEFGTFADVFTRHYAAKAPRRGDTYRGELGTVITFSCPTPDGLPVNPQWRPKWAQTLKVSTTVTRERLQTW
jgi:hypothetical protein